MKWDLDTFKKDVRKFSPEELRCWISQEHSTRAEDFLFECIMIWVKEGSQFNEFDLPSILDNLRTNYLSKHIKTEANMNTLSRLKHCNKFVATIENISLDKSIARFRENDTLIIIIT